MIIFQYYAVRRITAPPAYGEIVESMPRPAYGMKDEENLDMWEVGKLDLSIYVQCTLWGQSLAMDTS